MKIATLILSTVALGVMAGGAQAAVLKNLDKAPVEVTVKHKNKVEKVVLKPNESINRPMKRVFFVVGTERQRVGEEGIFAVQGGKIVAQDDAAKQTVQRQAERKKARNAAAGDKRVNEKKKL